MADLGLALKIASDVFYQKVDKGLQPYMLHCIRVMNNLHTKDQELQSIAILHDVVEDSHFTIEDLKDLGFSFRVLSAVALLTHDPNVSYPDYIAAIAKNPDARLVKMADLEDNTSILRLKGLTAKDFKRMEKYHTAYVYLSKV